MVRIELLKLDSFNLKKIKIIWKQDFWKSIFEGMHENIGVRHVGFKSGLPKVAMQGVICTSGRIWDTNNRESWYDSCGSKIEVSVCIFNKPNTMFPMFPYSNEGKLVQLSHLS